MSDDGSDDNDCHSESAPCKNLQTVLDRASDGADIYVTSRTLSLDLVQSHVWFERQFYYSARWKYTLCCRIYSSLSYSIRGIDGAGVEVTCSRKYTFDWLRAITSDL